MKKTFTRRCRTLRVSFRFEISWGWITKASNRRESHSGDGLRDGGTCDT